MRISITKKLIVYSLMLGLSSTSVIGIYTYIKIKDALLSRTFDQLISVRNEKTKRIESFFNERSNDLQNLINFEDVKKLIKLLNSKNDHTENYNKDKLESVYNDYIAGYLQANNFYEKLILCNSGKETFQFDVKNKKLLFNKIDTSDRSLLNEILTDSVKNDSLIIFEKKPIDKESNPTLIIADKTTDNKVDTVVIMLEVSMKPIDQIMFEDNPQNGLGETGEAYIVGKDMLMRSSSRFQKNAVYSTIVNTEGVQAAFKNQTGESKINDYRNVLVLSSFGQIQHGNINWAILAEIDYKEATVPIKEIRGSIFYLLIIIGLFMLGVIAVVSNMITAPIIKLRQATDKVTEGEFGKTLDLEINDEIGDLIHAFNEMTSRLKLQSEKLEEQKLMSLQSLIDGQEIERQRLSRELHDGLAQLILAIKMRTERALNVHPDVAQQIIKDSKELLVQTLTEIRNISNNLMPAVLSNFGLKQALMNLVNDTEKIQKFSIYYSCKSELLINNKKRKPIPTESFRRLSIILLNTLMLSRLSLSLTLKITC
jgi:HAMP domain-containing protein